MAKFTSNISSVQDRLRFRKIEVGSTNEVLEQGMDSALILMKRRIFNKCQATDGSSLGKYISEKYKAMRRAAGRRTDKKDLQFNGNLFGGIKVFTVRGGKVEIRFTTTKLAVIGRSQEIQIQNIRAGRKANSGRSRKGVPIFKLSPAEKKNALDVTKTLLRQKLKTKNATGRLRRR